MAYPADRQRARTGTKPTPNPLDTEGILIRALLDIPNRTVYVPVSFNNFWLEVDAASC